MEKFKPNLIANEPKDGSFSKEDREALIEKNGGIEHYIVFVKKDGCRLEAGVGPNLLTRSLKQPGSLMVRERFKAFNDLCLKLNVIVEGEFYMHGETFNNINRFFAKSDVTTSKYRNELEKALAKDPDAFNEKYNGKDIDFLTTFHEDLKFWMFDVIILDRPDLTGFKDRFEEVVKRFEGIKLQDYYVVFPDFISTNRISNLDIIYNKYIEEGWEGLILTHKNHVYKKGRSTLKEGTIFKMKEDKNEYDGVVIGVEESTIVKDGVDKSINELGRSVTSKKKGDRLPSGMAKGFLVEFEGKGTFCVGLNGFNHEERKEVFDNPEKYIGKHFIYTGMKPLKNFPRHAYFKCWRDEK